MYPKGKYSIEVQIVLNNAIKEQRKLKHPYVGSEHILLAILAEQDFLITKWLHNFGLTYKTFSDNVKTIIGIGSKQAETTLFTPLANRVVENAIVMSLEDGEDELTIYHLLLSILEEGEGVAIRVIQGIGISIDDLFWGLTNSKSSSKSNLNYESMIKENEVKVKKNMNKKNEVYMTYCYDVLGCFDEKEDIIHIRKLPVALINDNDFEKIENETVILNEIFLEGIKNRSSLFGTKTLQNITICGFSSKKSNKSIAVKFDQNGKSVGKFIPESDVNEEWLEVFGRMGEYEDTIISSSSVPEKNVIYIMDLIVKKIVQNQQSFEIEKQKEKTKKQSSGKISRYDCLIDMNKEVRENNTIITGFDDEIKSVIKGLLKIKKPNVLITGEPGVGKTALVEKLACLINEGKVPSIFKNHIVVQLNMSAAVAGTKYRGEFEQKMLDIVKVIEETPNIILFIDEFHTVIGAGGAEGAIDASNILKPALARGKIKCIGATTNREFEEFIKQDSAFTRRFTRIDILEPNKENVLNIMKSARVNIEKTYGIIVTDSKIEEIYDIAKYKEGRMPDVALDELEEYCIEKYYENEIEDLPKEKENKKNGKVKS